MPNPIASLCIVRSAVNDRNTVAVVNNDQSDGSIPPEASQRRRYVWQIAALILLALCCTDVLRAADIFADRRKAASKFKPGDKVEVTSFDRTERGEVLEITEFGKVRVSTPRFERGRQFNPDDVRLLSKKAKTQSPDAKDEVNPFTTDEEKFQEVGKRTWTDRSGKFRI